MILEKNSFSWKNERGDDFHVVVKDNTLVWDGTLDDEGKIIPLQTKQQSKESFLARGPATTSFPWFETDVPYEILKKICYLLTINPPWLTPLSKLELDIFRSREEKETKKALDQGASPNTGDRFGFNILWYALHAADDKKAANLIQSGADISQTFPLPGIDGSLLFLAAKNECLESLKLLLKTGLDGNTTDEQGKNALFYLSTTPRGCSVAETLLDHGLKPDHTDRQGNTPLHQYAENFSAANLITILIDRGADINLKNNYNHTPLFNVVIYYKLYKDLYGYRYNEVKSIVNKFISAGADTMIIDTTGNHLDKMLQELGLNDSP